MKKKKVKYACDYIYNTGADKLAPDIFNDFQIRCKKFIIPHCNKCEYKYKLTTPNRGERSRR